MTTLQIWTESTMSEKSFITEWRRRLNEGQQGVVLVEVGHPLEIYVGASDLEHPLVQIRSTVKPKLPEISELVLISRKEISDHWVMSLNLQDRRFTDVFMRLVTHLVTASRGDATQTAAWASVDDVLDEWKRLLRPRAPGVLSLEELRGLVGELWLLLNRFAAVMPLDQAMAGWLGPLNAPQDFWYEKSGFHEAKAIGPTATRVKISSAHQLDEPGMELLVLQLPQVAESDAGATNLRQLVDRARSALLAAGFATDELEFRLKRMGVDIHHPFYGDNWFRVAAVESFAVGDAFPAVRHSALQPGVDRVRYTLQRSAIAPFLTATDLI